MHGIAKALQFIFEQGKFADKVIEQLLKSEKKWGSRDRAFVAENTYEIVRWWRLLWTLADEEPSFETHKLIRLTGVNLLLKYAELPPWREFHGLAADPLARKKAALSNQLKIEESIPDWLDETGYSELRDLWPGVIHSLNQTACVALRVNTLKINLAELQKLLDDEGWKSVGSSLAPDALLLAQRGNIFQSQYFKKGFFEVQDAGSQCIAPYLQVEPGMRVIDACAGAGGKSLHIAALMQNKGNIIALDTEAWKLDELKNRARRGGVDILHTRVIDSNKVIKRLHESADRLLLDVPCSGLGVLRRNPDAKWKLSPEFLEKVKNTQAEILGNYTRMLRKGGIMVYATCSILPSENEMQVQHFLNNNKDFILLEEQNISPATHDTDGFYMARIQKS
jgi:16S rRNA (cytosine967-C5)-methyltransferase